MCPLKPGRCCQQRQRLKSGLGRLNNNLVAARECPVLFADGARSHRNMKPFIEGTRLAQLCHCENNLYAPLTEIQEILTLEVHHSIAHNFRKATLMKKLILVSALLASSGLCLAQQVGRVISAT